jgi:sugar phosphate isomerase/epimerase
LKSDFVPMPLRAPMTRRTALQRLALAGAGLPLLGGVLARAASVEASEVKPAIDPRFKLGVASYTLRGMPLDNALVAVRRVGLNYISINRAHLPWENSPPGWAASVQKFKAAGVEVRCCGVMTLKNDEAAVRTCFEYARTLGVKVLACSPEPAALPLVERCVKEFDIRAAIHNHGPEDKTFPSPHEVWAAIQPFDPRIGLCIDVGHAFRAGADPAECIRRYRERLYDIHLKDTLAPVGAEDLRVEVGRGHINQRAILNALIETAYAQMVWFEYEKDPADPVPGLAESVGFIRGLLTGMGLDAAGLARVVS